jgi:hypothetical protein
MRTGERILKNLGKLRVAIILVIYFASASTAKAAEPSPAPVDNDGHQTTVSDAGNSHHHYHHHYHHHRFHPVHEASELIHKATGTKPTRPKPVVN